MTNNNSNTKPRRYLMPRAEWDKLSEQAKNLVRSCRNGSLRVDRVEANRKLADYKAKAARRDTGTFADALNAATVSPRSGIKGDAFVALSLLATLDNIMPDSERLLYKDFLS